MNGMAWRVEASAIQHSDVAPAADFSPLQPSETKPQQHADYDPRLHGVKRKTAIKGPSPALVIARPRSRSPVAGGVVGNGRSIAMPVTSRVGPRNGRARS